VSRFYLRRDSGPRENLGAAAVALGVGTAVFYVVRMLLAREGLDREAPKRLGKTEERLDPAVSKRLGKTGADVASVPDSDG